MSYLDTFAACDAAALSTDALIAACEAAMAVGRVGLAVKAADELCHRAGSAERSADMVRYVNDPADYPACDNYTAAMLQGLRDRIDAHNGTRARLMTRERAA
jgi:hypothetical protein